MNIPTWAERALEGHKPRASTWSKDRAPDAAAMALWESYTARFRKQWFALDADKWKVPKGEAGDRAMSGILTAALGCAKRLGNGPDAPKKVIQARKQLLKIDEKISKAAEDLAELLRTRDDLEEDHGVKNWLRSETGLDPMDLWDAMEMAFNPEPHSGREVPRSDVWPKLCQQLHIARETSLSVPEWPDLLNQLADRYESGTGLGDFPDITDFGSDTNKSQYSPWCHALIKMLKDYRLLDYLTHDQLASLASVAFDAKEGAINAKQMGALVRSQTNNN